MDVCRHTNLAYAFVLCVYVNEREKLLNMLALIFVVIERDHRLSARVLACVGDGDYRRISESDDTHSYVCVCVHILRSD